jgi:hypothetical protein
MKRPRGPAALRAGAVLGALLLGLATGLAVVLVHDRVLGLLLGLAATGATVVAVPRGARRLGFVAGWVAFVGYAVLPRPEGDYLVGADLEGYLLLATAPVLVVVALVTFPPPRRAVGRSDGSS